LANQVFKVNGTAISLRSEKIFMVEQSKKKRLKFQTQAANNTDPVNCIRLVKKKSYLQCNANQNRCLLNSII
jgi:hypothetical protein